jgi:hypothetical protein
MAQLSSLGPRTFGLPHAHHTHHSWLSRFRPQERRALISEDRYARNHVAVLLVGVMGIGLSLMATTIWWCL